MSSRWPSFPTPAGQCCAVGKREKDKRISVVIARIDESTCTACGLCSDVCPVHAITVNDVARVDAETCIGCGVCEAKCPTDAISMEEMQTTGSPVRQATTPESFQEPKTAGKMRREMEWGTGDLGRDNKANGEGFLQQIASYFRTPGIPPLHGRGRRHAGRHGGGRGRRRGRRA